MPAIPRLGEIWAWLADGNRRRQAVERRRSVFMAILVLGVMWSCG
jgi:hypothetical protein